MFNQIDIHGCTTIEAKIRLDNYSSKILQQFIRKQYKHKRAGRRILTMNAGETIIQLK